MEQADRLVWSLPGIQTHQQVRTDPPPSLGPMSFLCVCVCVCACRKVVEHGLSHGLYMKHCKVEVYLLEFKLCLHPKLNEPVNMTFSRAETIGMPCSLCRAHSLRLY